MLFGTSNDPLPLQHSCDSHETLPKLISSYFKWYLIVWWQKKTYFLRFLLTPPLAGYPSRSGLPTETLLPNHPNCTNTAKINWIAQFLMVQSSFRPIMHHFGAPKNTHKHTHTHSFGGFCWPRLWLVRFPHNALQVTWIVFEFSVRCGIPKLQFRTV